MPSAMKTFQNRASRRCGLGATRPQPTMTIKVTGLVAATTTITATFDQVVILNGVPAYTTDVVGATAISAAQTSPTTIEITFSASVAAATALNIPYEEPAVRNASG